MLIKSILDVLGGVLEKGKALLALRVGFRLTH